MHESVRQYVREHLPPSYRSVIEVGSLDINGGVRDLLDPKAEYVGIDLQPGPGVDIVVDFAIYQHSEPADVVLCLEVLEHTPKWREIIASAARNLRPGGTLLLTCATTGRGPHSARSADRFQLGEFYENVTKTDLEAEMEKHFLLYDSEVVGYGLYALAMRGARHE